MRRKNKGGKRRKPARTNQRVNNHTVRFLSLNVPVLFPTVQAGPEEEQRSAGLVEENCVYGSTKHKGKLVPF